MKRLSLLVAIAACGSPVAVPRDTVSDASVSHAEPQRCDWPGLATCSPDDGTLLTCASNRVLDDQACPLGCEALAVGARCKSLVPTGVVGTVDYQGPLDELHLHVDSTLDTDDGSIIQDGMLVRPPGIGISNGI